MTISNFYAISKTVMSTKFPITHSSCKDSRLMTLGCETTVSKFGSATEGCDQESTQMPESHRDKFKTIRKTDTCTFF